MESTEIIDYRAWRESNLDEVKLILGGERSLPLHHHKVHPIDLDNYSSPTQLVTELQFYGRGGNMGRPRSAFIQSIGELI